MNIRPVAAELFHADGLTKQTRRSVALYNFANAPNNQVNDGLRGRVAYRTTCTLFAE